MTGRVYVAVIDDDESLCRSMCRLLHQAGLHAISFSSAEEFLADPLSSHFTCLLVDVQLLGMSGIELHQRLIESGMRTPVIYITAYDDTAARDEAQALGCAGFFRKSDSGPEIIEAIRRVSSPGAARRRT
ncbi:MAG: response regulator [Steroidobacteraceae bacterium]|jgi:FixJ family two-component response regulator|nr:response regulator [Steroidobacteraceae bacterium]